MKNKKKGSKREQGKKEKDIQHDPLKETNDSASEGVSLSNHEEEEQTHFEFKDGKNTKEFDSLNERDKDAF